MLGRQRSAATGACGRQAEVRHASVAPAASLRQLRAGTARPTPTVGATIALGAVFVATAANVRVVRRRSQVRLAQAAAAVHEQAAPGGGPELKSDLGIDFRELQRLLKAEDFKAADAETRRLLIQLAGEAAVKRGWIYFAEVRRMPDADMTTMNDLWGHFSQGKFGFVPQRKIWRKVRGQFDKFAEEVSWFTDKWKNRNWPDEFVYNLEAPVGHLPLTNCIRGAQVLQELLSHPAWDKKADAPVASAQRSAMSLLAVGGARTAAFASRQATTTTLAGSSRRSAKAGAHRAPPKGTARLRAAAEKAAPSRSSVEKDVKGKRVAFDITYIGEYETNGGLWVDVEVVFNTLKSNHRIIIGKDFAAGVQGQTTQSIVENAFAVLLARKVPLKTSGPITSEIFPSNYFTVTNLATSFPEYLELLGIDAKQFNWDAAQWNFKQVHDYAQDDKRTIPTGPMDGVFDPLALQ